VMNWKDVEEIAVVYFMVLLDVCLEEVQHITKDAVSSFSVLNLPPVSCVIAENLKVGSVYNWFMKNVHWV
jgi:hypothetical protein